ncbi:hypothetical protein GCM10011378_40880 [Hymenobacter glacieicola]|uniref:RNA ligase domain-containing protein n=2 Tax=Hymenobacter glacieicola TaxID=1562124 RepID=A0ABQ1X5A3_9BACT|nr:hypothetical protein GCM10011378_40880 [Hymenobacter glacieicola]
MHLERFGTPEVLGIELGETYVFPKIDGTNASVWLEDGVVKAGSRNRELSLESDNAGFYAWASKSVELFNYLSENPNHRLFGEWLVPHSISTYRDDAWRKFYVFDVAAPHLMAESEEEPEAYLPYNAYKPLLERHGIEYLAPLKIIRNGTFEAFCHELQNNVCLIKDGQGCGEGVVIKNYAFFNKYGRQTWAKIVTSEFKEKHAKTMGAPLHAERKLVEEEIATEFVTQALVDKVFAKIDLDGGFTARRIPQLLHTVYYDVVREECWNFVKARKNPTINFNTLQHFVFGRVKALRPDLF